MEEIRKKMNKSLQQPERKVCSASQREVDYAVAGPSNWPPKNDTFVTKKAITEVAKNFNRMKLSASASKRFDSYDEQKFTFVEALKYGEKLYREPVGKHRGLRSVETPIEIDDDEDGYYKTNQTTLEKENAQQVLSRPAFRY